MAGDVDIHVVTIGMPGPQGPPGGGSADHGSLTGLGDDDHPQYVLRSILTTNGDLFTRAGGVVTRIGIGADSQVLTVVAGVPVWQPNSGTGVTDHGALTGLADNDHPQYLLVADIDDVPVNGEVAQPISSNWAFDHVAAADPHPGYTTTAELSAAITAHEAAGDPHPGYLTAAEGAAAFEAAGAVAAHAAAGDPHTGYRLESADHNHQSSGAQAGQLDHGLALLGLSDDDHPQYVLRSILTTNGDLFTRSGGVIARLGIGADSQVLTVVAGALAWAASGGSGVTDHGALTGLADNDHPQYLLVADIDDTPVNGEVAQPISSNWAFDHVAAADPHTGYRLESADHNHQSSGAQAGQLDHGLALTGLTDDDHTQYVLRSILTTNGDLFTRAGGVIDRIGVGSDTQVLTVVAGAPAWAAASSGTPDLYAENPVAHTPPSAGGNNAVAIGSGATIGLSSHNSVAFGTGATINEADAVAIGEGATANGAQSVSIGSDANCNSVATGGIALGDGASCVSQRAIAIGFSASSGNSSATIAIGDAATVVNGAIGAVAIGDGATANNSLSDNAVAIGTAATVSVNAGIAIGNTANVSGSGGLAIGDTTTASASGSIAIGSNASAAGARGLAIGLSAAAAGADSVAIGEVAAAPAAQSIAIGSDVVMDAAATGAIAIGDNASINDPDALRAIAIGVSAAALGLEGIAIGDGATSGTSDSTLAIGNGATVANGSGDAIAIGRAASVSGAGGARSVAIGINANCDNVNEAIAIGDGARAWATQSISIGDASIANGSAAIRIGKGGSAGAANSIAIGEDANSSGVRSIAIGASSAAAAGQETIAIGDGATSGSSTGAIAIGDAATVNNSGTGSIAIGDGASVGAHANAITIGAAATSSAANQVTLGDAAVTEWVPGATGVASLGSSARAFTNVFAAAIAKIDSTSLVFGTSSPLTLFTTGAGDVIEKVEVIIDTTFTGTPTLSVGIVGTTAKYMATSDVDLTMPAGTVFQVHPGVAAAGVENLIATYSAGGAGAGAARIRVHYGTPS